jgi:hypothetical protein
MIFHPVVVNITLVAAVGVAAAPRVWSLAVRSWTWLNKLFRKTEKPAEPWNLVASIRRVFPNGGSFEFGLSWQKGCAPPPQTPAAPAVGHPVNQFGPPASSAPSLQLDLCSNSNSALPVPASLLPLIVGN